MDASEAADVAGRSGPTAASTSRIRRLLIGEHEVGDVHDPVAGAVPRNAALQVVALGMQQAGDLVMDPRTVLVWLLAALGAPTAVVGLLVPVREAGSMLPQVALVAWVRRRPLRKRVWILGAVLQAGCAGILAIVAITMRGAAAGIAVVAVVAVFALARALSSIATKDVLGKTIHKGSRGRITGAASMASGFVAITLGVALRARGGDADPGVFALLLIGGAAVWLGAAIVCSRVREPAGQVEEDDTMAAISRAWTLVRDDRDLRRFITARGLLLVSALSPPFVVSLASARGGGGLEGLGPFVIGTGVASLVGGRMWGPLADRSSRLVMMWAAGSASTVIVGLLLVLRVEEAADNALLYPAAYLLLALAHTGSRI
ncbi:MAG TPA: hypothetical protein VMM13_18190, partial [Euzebya sp.]|nr:hypothetical protein [Euzebya sp.]